jgi:predicted transcriptional regulator with HTH domain
MPKISDTKKEKISEQILHFLFTTSPEAKYTSDIAKELARDEEFTKDMLVSLNQKKLVSEVNKNSKGVSYLKRQRWRLSNEAYNIYLNYQKSTPGAQLPAQKTVSEFDSINSDLSDVEI